MAKRRGKHHWRRSLNHSPKNKSNSIKQIKNDSESWESDRLSTNSSEINCQSPSTIKKKRKCDICAAMLTVSYLRQKGLASEHRKEENIDEKEQHDSLEMLQVSDGHDTHYLHSHTPLHSRIGLTKSFSFPILRTMKTKDYELKELKNKFKDCKDILTIKDKFILPMNQWNDAGFLKPMLTRPSSFKSSCPTSQMEKKKNTNNSKGVKQKFGFAIKDNRKEKKRILMDAVFHKIPYGRRSSKNPKKISLDKLKSNSTSSGSDRSSIGEKTHLKKTSSTSEAMGKYRRLLSQTSTRDDKLHLHDHKPRLFVAGEHSHGSSERKTHKRIRSLPDIGLYDFKHNQEFPDKPNMDIHLNIGSEIFDEQMSLDHFVERRNVYSATTEGIRKETKLIVRDEPIDENIQEKIDHKPESSSEIENAMEETKLVDKDDHPENNDHQKKLSVDFGTTATEGDLVNKDEVVDENLGAGLVTSDQQEKIVHQNEPRVVIEVEQEKNFNEILGMFKKVSDERKKQNYTIESSGAIRKVAKNTRVENDHNAHKHLPVDQKTFNHHEKDKSQLTSSSDVDKDQNVHMNLEVDNKPLDQQEKDGSLLPSGSKLEMSIPESIINSSSLVNISKSPLKSIFPLVYYLFNF